MIDFPKVQISITEPSEENFLIEPYNFNNSMWRKAAQIPQHSLKDFYEKFWTCGFSSNQQHTKELLNPYYPSSLRMDSNAYSHNDASKNCNAPSMKCGFGNQQGKQFKIGYTGGYNDP